MSLTLLRSRTRLAVPRGAGDFLGQYSKAEATANGDWSGIGLSRLIEHLASGHPDSLRGGSRLLARLFRFQL